MKLPNLSILGKPWVLLVIAFALGGTATVMTVSYLRTKEAQVRASLMAKEGSMTQVVVPSYNLPKGSRISYDNMAVREVPEALVSSLMLTAGNFSTYVGQELGYDAEAGKPLVRPMLRFAGLKDFSDTIPESMRAITIRVDELNSISGMLRPGDRIDIFVKMSDQGSQDVVFPLLYNVAVKATGQMVEGEEQLATGQGGPGSQTTYNTVTLEVTPKDAQRLVLAQAAGKITAVMRNADDYVDIDLGQLRKDTLLTAAPAPMAPTGEVAATVRYVLGGQSSNGSPRVVNMPYLGSGVMFLGAPPLPGPEPGPSMILDTEKIAGAAMPQAAAPTPQDGGATMKKQSANP